MKLLLLIATVCFYPSSSQNFPERAFALSTTGDRPAQEQSTEEARVEDELDPEDQEVFYPTREWQVVRPGQAVPAGLHMRLNLQTGTNEAKLPDPRAAGEEGKMFKKQEKRLSLDPDQYTPQELKKALAKLKEGVTTASLEEEKAHKDDIQRRFRPIEELKQEFKRLHVNMESDFQIMAKLIKTLNSSTTTLDEKSAALYDLEYYVHQVDNAQDLLPLGGLQLVINGLNSTEPVLKERSAFVLGAALSSNPRVQVKAMEGGALHRLLVILATEQPLSVKKKALFALSSMLRQFPYAQQQFLKLGGMEVLKGIFRERGVQTLSVRVVTLLYDLMVEKKMAMDSASDDEFGKEKIQQYDQVDLVRAVQDQGWCTLISGLLGVPEHDHREKVLKTLNVLLSSCRDPYKGDEHLNTTLTIFRKEYEELVAEEQKEGENDGYFKELLSTVIGIIEELR